MVTSCGSLIVVILLTVSSHTAWAGPLVKLDNGLGKTPPMGWNSWDHFFCNISQAVIYKTVDVLISSGLAELGYNYVNVDDCWAELSRDSEGRLVPRKDTFPDGIKALADYAHSKGLKFGIYSDAGFYTCQRQPGSLGFEKKDAESFAAWGVDYLKYDNCYDDRTIPEIRYPVMRDALNATGRPIFFSMCEWGVDSPARWAAKVGNSWRTTRDIWDTWENVPELADINNEWASYAGPGGWNDPDLLEVGNGGMTWTEYKSQFSLWALMKAPLLIGSDLTSIAKEAMEILSNKEVIAVNQDPLGVQGRKVWKKGQLEVWAGPLSGGRKVVLLFNLGDKRATITANWEVLGMKEDVEMNVRDLWTHKDLPTANSYVKDEVESHGIAMFVLTPARQRHDWSIVKDVVTSASKLFARK